MRALILACCALVPVCAWADAPMPEPKPGAELPPPVVVAPVEAPRLCQNATAGEMWAALHDLTSKPMIMDEVSVLTGRVGGQMLDAMASVTGEPRRGATAVVMLAWTDGDQTWIGMTDKCVVSETVLKPAQLAAIAALLRAWAAARV